MQEPAPEELQGPGVAIERNNQSPEAHALGELGLAAMAAENSPEFEEDIERITRIVRGEEDGVLTADDAYKLIDDGAISYLAYHLHCFSSLNVDIANILIDAGESEAVARNLGYRFSDLNADFANKLIDAGMARCVVDQLKWFAGLDYQNIANKLIDAGEISLLARTLLDFTSLDIDIANKLIDAGKGECVIIYAKSFTSLDADIAGKLIDAGLGEAVAARLNIFTSLDIDIANKLFDMGEEIAVSNNLSKFTGLDVNIANKLFDNGSGGLVAHYLESFTGLDHQEIADRLFDAGLGHVVATHIHSLTDLDQNDIANKLIDAVGAASASMYLDRFTSLDIDIAHKLIDAGKGDALAIYLDHFINLDRKTLLLYAMNKNVNLLNAGEFSEIAAEVSRDDEEFSGIGALIGRVITNDDTTAAGLQAYGELCKNVLSTEDVPIALKYQERLFGNYGSVQTIRTVYDLLEGRLTPELSELGVYDTGEVGVLQLEKATKQFIDAVRSGTMTEADEQKLERSAILRAIFMTATEFNATTGFGSHKEEELQRKLESRNQAVLEGRYEPLREGYEASRIYEVTTSNSKKEKPIFSEDVLERYRVLREDIQYATQALSQPNAFGRLVKELRGEIDGVVLGLEAMVRNIDESDPYADRKRQSLEQRLAKLKEYLREADDSQSEQRRFVLNSPADVQRGFTELEPYKELHPSLRRLFFAWAIRKNPEQKEGLESLNSDNPSYDDFAATREFIEHITNQETFGEYFTDKKQARAFQQMSSTKALEEGMTRYNKQATAGGSKAALQFIPSRGTLLEISGQIGNACWADKYELIGESMPNMTAVIMRARPGQKSERIVGSALLIETTNPTTGDGVLVLRGTNPTENYIGTVDPSDFYEAITDYARQTAEARGLTPAVVIDDHSGGSGTNRPLLFGYMSAMKRELKKIAVDDTTTNFNSYNITNDAYAL